MWQDNSRRNKNSVNREGHLGFDRSQEDSGRSHQRQQLGGRVVAGRQDACAAFRVRGFSDRVMHRALLTRRELMLAHWTGSRSRLSSDDGYLRRGLQHNGTEHQRDSLPQ